MSLSNVCVLSPSIGHVSTSAGRGLAVCRGSSRPRVQCADVCVLSLPPTRPFITSCIPAVRRQPPPQETPLKRLLPSLLCFFLHALPSVLPIHLALFICLSLEVYPFFSSLTTFFFYLSCFVIPRRLLFSTLSSSLSS